MKTLNSIALLTATIFLSFHIVVAQDDFYPSKKKTKNKDVEEYLHQEETINDADYSTATDYYYDKRAEEAQEEYNRQMGITDSTTYYEDENGNVRITNNYYNGDNYNFENEYYDYEYTSRIRRFHRPVGRYGYYDDYYTNYYYYNYDPYYYGTSVYVSYGWWYPSPWRWSVGWGWGGGYYGGGWGWNYGWGHGWGSPWHWGYGGGWGWYGSSYWGGYNHGYWDGYHDGLYASGNYYNSYDRNSYYYGKRGGSSGSEGYGGVRNTSINNSGKSLSFGEKYEQAIKSNPSLNTTSPKTGISNQPKAGYNTPVKQNTATNGNMPIKTNPNTNTPPKYGNAPTKTNTGTNYPVKPSTKPTNNYSPPKKANGQVNPNTPQPNNYTPKPKSSYGTPRNNTKPTYTPQPSKPKPTYNKPSPRQNYNPPKSSPKPSYSAPKSSGSFNKGGSRPGGSYGGGARRSPR